jgi:hypothetical protein
MPIGRPQRERRDTSPSGTWTRKQIDASLRQLRDLGLSNRAVDYFRTQARDKQRLPYVLMLETVEDLVREAGGIGVFAAPSRWKYQ